MTVAPRQTILPSLDGLGGAVTAGDVSPTNSELVLATGLEPGDSTDINAPPIASGFTPVVSLSTAASQVFGATPSATLHTSKLKLPLIVSLAGLAMIIAAFILATKAKNRRRLKIQTEPPAVRPPCTGSTSIIDNRMTSQVSLMVPLGRNPETSTLFTMATLASHASVIVNAQIVHSSTSIPALQVGAMRPKLEKYSTRAVDVSSTADIERTRQETLTRMLTEDPAPSWRARFGRRSRSRRRRAVDGGVRMNETGYQRSGSPVPTTVSTLATGDSVGASTLPPAYAQYN